MSASHHLTIVQINDTHGYLEPHPELVWGPNGPTFPQMGGYARIATILEQARADNPGGVLALDNGDTFHGTYIAMATRGEALVPLVNALQFDAMTAHWEFAWGPEHVKELAARLNHPVLAINCYSKASGRRPFQSSIMLNRAGMRIGIIGIAATIIDKVMPPHFGAGHRFTLGNEELPEEITALRAAGADFIVVLSHLGFPQDLKLAQTVSGIDVLVSGHTHNRLETPAFVGKTIIIQSGCHGSFAGRLDIDVRDGEVAGCRHRLVALGESVPLQPAMAQLVENVVRPYRIEMGKRIGTTALALHRATTLDAPMDDVLLAAIAATARTEIAFSNGWRYGAPVPPGPITLNDLWNIIPPNPPVSTVELSGGEIRQMMEESLQSTFAADPFEQMGGNLKRFRGLTIYGKLENPQGHRIERMFASGGLLEPDRRYEAAFVTAQGVPSKYGSNRQDLATHAIDALRDYLRVEVPDIIPGAGRFVLV